MGLPTTVRVAIIALLAGALGACAASTSLTSSAGPSGTPGATAAEAASPAGSPVPSPTPTSTAPPTLLPTAGSWSSLSVEGPAPAAREAHTLTVDPASGVAYLFGGRDGGSVFGDLWRLDPRALRWQALDPSGPRPPARFGHNAVWLAGRGLVIYAGQSATGFFNDLWLYDPAAAAWTPLPAGGDPPIPRYGSCAALGTDGRLWVSHGFTEEKVRFADTRAYDFPAGRWSDQTPSGGDLPVARCLHACFRAADGRFVLYGGQTTGVAALGDLWALTTGGAAGSARWAEMKEALPAPRNLPAFTVRDGGFVVFGGGSLERGFLADSWVFSLSDLNARALAIDGSPPPARSGAAMIDDPTNHRILLFGGRDGDVAFADLWALELH